MRFRNLEINYLIALLASTLNKRTTPAPLRALDWRELYYLAEYHNITNICFYSLIGLYDVIPDIWKERFSKIFRKWVGIYAAQEKDITTLMDELEEEKIDYMMSKDWMMKRCYPQAEMRIVEDIVILIKPRYEKSVRALMKEMGYHCEESDDGIALSFYKNTNFSIIFVQQLFNDNPKLENYYQKPWKKLRTAVGYGTRYAFSIEDQYIYMMASACNLYAEGEIDARHIIDIFLYLKRYKNDMDILYIEQELVKLELDKISKCLVDVGDMWLGVYEGGDAGDSRDVEEYVWSKGSYGRETSARLMPMLIDLNLWRIREARKKKIIKFLRWIFPRASHMVNRFPSIEQRKLLLPFYWILRWFVLCGFALNLCFVRLKRSMSRKLYEKLSKKSMADGMSKDE